MAVMMVVNISIYVNNGETSSGFKTFHCRHYGHIINSTANYLCASCDMLVVVCETRCE